MAYEDARSDEERAIAEIVVRYEALMRKCDAVLVVGSDFTDAGGDFPNRVHPQLVHGISVRLAGHEPPVFVLPEVGLVAAPTVGDLQRACSGELIGGDASALGHVAGVVGADTDGRAAPR